MSANHPADDLCVIQLAQHRSAAPMHQKGSQLFIRDFSSRLPDVRHRPILLKNTKT
jgi:hypothetical protein